MVKKVIVKYLDSFKERNLKEVCDFNGVVLS